MTTDKTAENHTVSDRTPYWPARPSPKPGAPNVVLVLLDDCGFSQLGCYGSSIDTPNINRLAQNGVRYSNFHVTPMCSPTRAAMLTGRNHHSAGVGYLADFDTGFDNARGAISHRTANLAEMLKSGGYGTYALGKWHLTPPSDCSAVGPFDHWPTQRGFDRYYGFLGGEDDQYAPELWRDQQYAPLPDRDDYHLSEDLAQEAINVVSDHVTTTPDRPFFLYLAFGACHAPHQAPRSFIDKYKGQFDDGWDVERERVLARQRAMGIVPDDTVLPERNHDVMPWDEVEEDAKPVLRRMQEVFAGFTEHTDVQIGRIIGFLEELGAMTNTLFIVASDNGASGEGGRYGSENEYRYFLGLPDKLEENKQAIDKLGGPWTHNHYPSGWAQAGNTPLRMYKKFTFGGGVRAPLIMHWPAEIGVSDEVRSQYLHAIDIAPTILDLAGVSAPTTYRGVEQLPLHGKSFVGTFADAAAPSPRDTQYYEMGGQRGIYHDGWKAVTMHAQGRPFHEDVWELYHLDTDYNETTNLAEADPERLDQLVRLWWDEAEKYGVLPLDDRAQARAFARDPATVARRHFRLMPNTRLLTPASGPNFAMRSFRVEAELGIETGEERGVLLAYGRRAAGFSFFVKDGKLWFDYNLAGRHEMFVSSDVVPLGTRRVSLDFQLHDKPRIEMRADDRILCQGEASMGFPAGFGLLTTQCGMNSPSPVSTEYDAPFAFSGRLRHVDVHLGEIDRAAVEDHWNAVLRRQ